MIAPKALFRGRYGNLPLRRRVFFPRFLWWGMRPCQQLHVELFHSTVGAQTVILDIGTQGPDGLWAWAGVSDPFGVTVEIRSAETLIPTYTLMWDVPSPFTHRWTAPALPVGDVPTDPASWVYAGDPGDGTTMDVTALACLLH